jgi:anti-anti-sigma factor
VPSQFRITVRDLPGIHIVALHGELDLSTAKGLSEELTAIAGSTVIDLADLTFMDSTGIAAVIAARNQIREEGDDLVVTRPIGIVQRTLNVTGLSALIVEWSDEWS